ncbi:MAG TPA: hypothetical protein VGQ06_07020 [Gemmatimonadales bacterium]|jgi:hypothetical protein|nr:hypothetical protein [Gemmatimonadales bacterium]
MRASQFLPLTALLVVGAPQIGQQPAQQPAQNPRIAAMKSALRNLVVAQENYFADHGTYTTDVSALGVYSRAKYRADSIWIQVIHGGGRSWSGRAIHGAQRAKSCAIYVGYVSDFPSPPVTDADSLPARNEGEPVCDPW